MRDKTMYRWNRKTRFSLILAGLVLLGVPALKAQTNTPGAPVPFVEFNAVTSKGVRTNGAVLPASYYFGTLTSEATGRHVVILSGRGRFISFTLTQPANAIVVHYAIPDSTTGNGMTEPLNLYVNGKLTTALSMTSAYSWLYGRYPFTHRPGLGMPGENAPHDFYNDVRYKFSSKLPKNTVVKLQVDGDDNAPWYAINTVDFTLVPGPIEKPVGAIDAVTQYGADPTGKTDSTAEIQNAIRAAEKETPHGTVYLPEGTYTISEPLSVNNVTVTGAGMWYTTLTGSHVEFSGKISPPSTNVNVSHLAIFGDVAVRDDRESTVNGFNGGFSHSTISNVWIQNTKVGVWIVGPTTRLTLDHLRIMDLKADGINFDAAHGAITSSVVENSFLRNTQDDGIAMWSENAPDTNIAIRHNTIDSPGLANNIAIYGGGQGDVIAGNLLKDPVTRGSCLHIGLRFNSVATSGPITVKNNKLERCGQFDPGFFFGLGAVWFWPQQGNMTALVNLSGNVIQASPYSAYMFLGPNSTTHVKVSKDMVSHTGTYVVQAQGPGSAKFKNVTATHVADGGFLNLSGKQEFTLTASGSTGWSATPAARAIPLGNPLWVYPDVVTFQTKRDRPATEQIAVINTAYRATAIGPITADAGFKVSENPTYPCGRSLATATFGTSQQKGWCLVDVTFPATTAGIVDGRLTIPNSEGKSVAVMLVGSTGGSTTAPVNQ